MLPAVLSLSMNRATTKALYSAVFQTDGTASIAGRQILPGNVGSCSGHMRRQRRSLRGPSFANRTEYEPVRIEHPSSGRIPRRAARPNAPGGKRRWPRGTCKTPEFCSGSRSEVTAERVSNRHRRGEIGDRFIIWKGFACCHTDPPDTRSRVVTEATANGQTVRRAEGTAFERTIRDYRLSSSLNATDTLG